MLKNDHDAYVDLEIGHQDIFGLSQLSDSYKYATMVIGHDPHKMDVLTGWMANTLTRTIAGSHRAMCLCLDFPSTGAATITAVPTAMGAAA